MRYLDGIIDAMGMNLGKLREMVRDREACQAVAHGVAKSEKQLGDWTTRAFFRELWFREPISSGCKNNQAKNGLNCLSSSDINCLEGPSKRSKNESHFLHVFYLYPNALMDSTLMNHTITNQKKNKQKHFFLLPWSSFRSHHAQKLGHGLSDFCSAVTVNGCHAHTQINSCPNQRQHYPKDCLCVARKVSLYGRQGEDSNGENLDISHILSIP